MMTYLVANCSLGELKSDVLIAYLLAIGFDSFEEKEDDVEAYAPMNEDIDKLKNNLESLAQRENISYSTKILEPQNWNAAWEANFDPVNVEDEILIRAEFHDKKEGFNYEIVISPKMAFGTGHHETTYMMLKHMLRLDLKDNQVLDYGSGTGILSVGASILGALNIVAVDIQIEAEDNAREHMSLNNVDNIHVITGDLSDVPMNQYDIILANINRNVILNTISEMYEMVVINGYVLISGIMIKDKELILNRAKEEGLVLQDMDQRGEWMFFNFQRNK